MLSPDDGLSPNDGAPKRRLTEHDELAVAAEFLISHGFAADEIAVQLSRFYYIDIDMLNDVVAALGSRHSGLAGRRRSVA